MGNILILLIHWLLYFQRGVFSSSDSSSGDAEGQYDDCGEKSNDETGSREEVPLGVSDEQIKQVL